MLKRGVELYDDGKPDDYLKYSLEMAGKVGTKLKVRGTVLGDFLGFYAEAGTASLKAAHGLRDKFVDQDLAKQLDSKKDGRPEKRLYTRQQIKNAILHGVYGNDAEEKVIHIAVMWQLRRLMYLLTHANNCGGIRDGGGL